MLESLFSKVAGRKETPTQVLSYAYCEFFNNIYFQKHLRTAVSDYSFTIVIYSFSVVSLFFTHPRPQRCAGDEVDFLR